MVEQLLRMFTLLSKDEIDAVLVKHLEDPGLRQAQRVLAREVTELVHGPSAVQQAKAATELLFNTNPTDVNVQDIVNALKGSNRLAFINRQDALQLPLSKLSVTAGLTASRGQCNLPHRRSRDG